MTRGIRVGLVPGDLIENTYNLDYNLENFNIRRPWKRTCFPTPECFWREQPWGGFEFCDELILVVHAFRDDARTVRRRREGRLASHRQRLRDCCKMRRQAVT